MGTSQASSLIVLERRLRTFYGKGQAPSLHCLILTLLRMCELRRVLQSGVIHLSVIIGGAAAPMLTSVAYPMQNFGRRCFLPPAGEAGDRSGLWAFLCEVGRRSSE